MLFRAAVLRLRRVFRVHDVQVYHLSIIYKTRYFIVERNNRVVNLAKNYPARG